jgi:hypothetical protein
VHADLKDKMQNYTIKKEYYENGLVGVEQVSDATGSVKSALLYTYDFWKKEK